MKPSFKPYCLSPQCIKVLNLIGDGFTDKEIASILGISENTVNGYVRKIADRLQAKSRAHAVKIWLTPETKQTP